MIHLLALVRDADPSDSIDPTAYVLIGLLGVGVIMTAVVLGVILFVLRDANKKKRPHAPGAKPILDSGSDKPIRLKRTEEADA